VSCFGFLSHLQDLDCRAGKPTLLSVLLCHFLFRHEIYGVLQNTAVSSVVWLLFYMLLIYIILLKQMWEHHQFVPHFRGYHQIFLTRTLFWLIVDSVQKVLKTVEGSTQLPILELHSVCASFVVLNWPLVLVLTLYKD